MKEKRVEALSDDMLDLVSGGAGQTSNAVDERKQKLLDMMDRYEAAQGGSGKPQDNAGSAYQDAIQNAMKQQLKNSQS